MEKQQEKKTVYRVLSIVGIVLCVVFGAILLMNTVMIIKSYADPDKVPSFGGIMPEIVLTESMDPYIKGGDIIIAKTVAPETVKTNDVISFFDPSSKGSIVVTHRVMGVIHKTAPKEYVLETVAEDGTPLTIKGEYSSQVFTVTFEDKAHGVRYYYDTEKTKEMRLSEDEYFFVTMGDNNGVQDRSAVPFSALVGLYTGTRFAGLGRVAMFMQTTPGLILCVMVPLVAFVGYDMMRRRSQDRKKAMSESDMMAELEALRAAKIAQDAADAATEKDGENAPPSAT